MRILTPIILLALLLGVVFSFSASFQVTRPLVWNLTYVAPGDPVYINWTAPVPVQPNPINYTVDIYNVSGALITTLAVNTSDLNATWINASSNGFYYANVSACDWVLVDCIYNVSALFGVYNTIITVGFGASAVASGTNIVTTNFTDYCQHSFYPNGTQFETGDDLTYGSGILAMEVFDPNPANSAANRPYVFTSVPPGSFDRTCYGINIYNETGIGPTRGIILTPPPSPPHSGTSTTTIPVNTVETILIIAFLILLIFVSTLFSEIKILGVLGAVLMVLLGMWIAMDGIYYKSGEVNVGKNTLVTVVSNITNLSTTTTYVNTTYVNTYDKIQVPLVNVIGVSDATANTILGIVVVLLGMFAMIYYSRIFTKWH